MFNKRMRGVFITVIVVLMISSGVYAAHTTISTADGQVDANWVNVSMISNDGPDFGTANYDINQGWVASASDDSAFYFRVNLVGQLPHDYSSLEARLDCDRNGSFQDSVDVVVYFAIDSASEELVECQGNEYNQCDYTGEPNNSDTNPGTFGEEITGSPNNYEWRADVDNGSTIWASCYGDINVQFATLDSSLAVQDTTAWQGYNVPSAVHIESFTAKQSHKPNSVFVFVAPIILLYVRHLLRSEGAPQAKSM